MGEYKPYLIAPIKHGKEEGMEPWLLPKDAFSTLKNCYINKGVLQKRLGYTEFNRFVHAVADEAIGASGSANYSGTLANYPIRAGDLSITDGTSTIDDDGDGTMSGDGAGTINYTTGDYDVTFSGATTDAVTADYDYYPGNAIVGIENFYTNSGSQDLMIWDTKRMCKYDETYAKLEDVLGTDVWTGDETSFVWTENWQDRLFITNGHDEIQSWDGSTISGLNTDIDDDASNDVDTCLLLFAYKERLVMLRTTEDGTTYPQRARWCKAGDPDDWVDSDSGGQGGYVDAPTLDWIIAAEFIGDDLIVWFERSIWKLRYTADSDLPFRWEKVVNTDGSYATFSAVSFSDEIISVGPTSLLATDGLDAYAIDDKIPNFVLDIDPSKFEYVYSIVLEELGQVLISYPSAGASSADHILALNYEEDSFSTYDLAFHCFGYYSEAGNYTIDGHPLGDKPLDSLEFSFDDRTQLAGYPITLAGDTSGRIWQLNSTGADDDSPIELEIITGRWNPFVGDGMKARFGFIDILVKRDPNISFYVDFYTDQNSTAHMTETVTCDGVSGNEEKVWKRVFVGLIGSFHRVRIRHTASAQTLKIYALMPWFKPAGKLR